MITVASYIALRYFVGEDWSSWLLVLPVFLDFTLLDRISK